MINGIYSTGWTWRSESSRPAGGWPTRRLVSAVAPTPQLADSDTVHRKKKTDSCELLKRGQRRNSRTHEHTTRITHGGLAA
jgi:hypothetical protein